MGNFVILFILAMVAFFIKVFQTEKLRSKVKTLEQQQATLLSQKKSSEVRTGFIGEKLAPLLKEFPEAAQNGENLISLGMPIDYIHFGDENIDFIEVKTGGAQLSAKQRRIKKLVEDGRITWHTVRIN